MIRSNSRISSIPQLHHIQLLKTTNIHIQVCRYQGHSQDIFKCIMCTACKGTKNLQIRLRLCHTHCSGVQRLKQSMGSSDRLLAIAKTIQKAAGHLQSARISSTDYYRPSSPKWRYPNKNTPEAMNLPCCKQLPGRSIPTTTQPHTNTSQTTARNYVLQHNSNHDLHNSCVESWVRWKEIQQWPPRIEPTLLQTQNAANELPYHEQKPYPNLLRKTSE